MSNNSYDHAIVIGGSIAGLMAARALTESFSRVTIIERDTLPEAVEFRKGVPQGQHPHLLLKRGEQIMESYFPGLVDDLKRAGAITINFGRDVRWYTFGEWRVNYDSTLELTGCSRPMLEGAIRGRLALNAQVTFLQRHEVLGLETDEAKSRVTGVKIASRDDRKVQKTLLADLVVDASGRDSHTPAWLTELGYTAPVESTVNSFPGYATRIYKKAVGFDWQVMYAQPVAPNLSRGAIITPLEGDRWHVTMIGINKDYPQTDEDGFLAFARSLPTPEIYEAIKDAEPITPIIGYRRAENRLYHYESLPRYLDNFVAIGDAVFAFNPVYGQGMSVASMGAVKLAEMVQKQTKAGKGLAGLAAAFQKQLAKEIAFPWQIATSEDMRWSECEGVIVPTNPVEILIGKYIQQVLFTANRSAYVLEAFARIQNMVASPGILFKPGVMFRVFASMNQRRKEQQTQRTPAKQLKPDIQVG